MSCSLTSSASLISVFSWSKVLTMVRSPLRHASLSLKVVKLSNQWWSDGRKTMKGNVHSNGLRVRFHVEEWREEKRRKQKTKNKNNHRKRQLETTGWENYQTWFMLDSPLGSTLSSFDLHFSWRGWPHVVLVGVRLNCCILKRSLKPSTKFHVNGECEIVNPNPTL